MLSSKIHIEEIDNITLEKDITINATVCPNCRKPNPLTEEEKQAEIKKKKDDETVAKVLIIVFIFGIIGFVVFCLSWWDNNDMDNKVINSVVDGINEITDMYVEYEYDKEREKELKNKVYNAFNIN